MTAISEQDLLNAALDPGGLDVGSRGAFRECVGLDFIRLVWILLRQRTHFCEVGHTGQAGWLCQVGFLWLVPPVG